jgi:hypothetical protein
MGKGTKGATKESRRLDKLKDESRNVAKRYKLPEVALNIIEKAGKVHGQKSRAIQVAVELIWNSPGYLVNIPPSISESPQVGGTYKLPPRTVGLIEALGKEYGTLGNALAACAVMLSRPDPREGLTKAPPLSKPDKVVYEPGRTRRRSLARTKHS